MKIKFILSGLILSVVAGGALAQDLEHDDMYFNSSDRVKLREATKANETTFASIKKADKSDDDNFNPTDSYSARNVNPEFTSRSQSQTAREDDEDYYVYNYQSAHSNYNNWNNNFNNWYGNSWYRPNYWSPSIYAWNSPYYGYYDSFNSPWYDPYWSYNGWSSSFSFHYGNSWNYGWGGNYNYWNRPYCGYNSFYGSNAYWNGYRYPNTIVVINNSESAGRGIAYGKRPTRGSSMVSDRSNNIRSRSSSVGSGRTDNAGGRVSSNGRSQTEYYNRTWRNNDSYSSPSMAPQNSRSSTQNNRSSNWSNSNSAFQQRNSTPSYSPARSTSDGAGTRSHSSGSGSGSNGRSRGRD